MLIHRQCTALLALLMSLLAGTAPATLPLNNAPPRSSGSGEHARVPLAAIDHSGTHKIQPMAGEAL